MSFKLAEVDKNMAAAAFEKDDYVFYNIKNEPFDVYGLYEYKKHEVFRRMPEDVAKATNLSVELLSKNPAGGRVRFKTDSPSIAIKLETHILGRGINMALTGSACCDLYINNEFFCTFMPPIPDFDKNGGYESEAVIRFMDVQNEMKDILINMPLYNQVEELYIGIKKGSRLEKGNEYKHKKPIVYYGSSITQGGCASHPGNAYQAMISRELDVDFINLGFSGGAHGEDAIVDYMVNLDMSIFVCDYDYNSVTAETLRNTHEKLFLKLRDKKPDVPVIFITRPDFHYRDEVRENIERRDIVYTTYMNAVRRGDKKVYFIDGDSLFAGAGHDACTVDGCHPNDLGFWRMADVIGRAIKKFL